MSKTNAKNSKITKKKVRRTKKGGCGKGGGRRKQKTSKKNKDKYICYTGIGSNKSGNHTEKEFLEVMNHNKHIFNEPVPKQVKTVDQWIQFSGASKGKCKKDKKDKTLRNKYKKISSTDCAKKYPKSRDKTLKCLDQKEIDLKSLESEFPEEMKLLKKELKDYEKKFGTFMGEAGRCNKHFPDMNKAKKCAEEVGKKYERIFKDNKEMSFILMNKMKDNLQRMIDHTQKVDLGELGKLK